VTAEVKQLSVKVKAYAAMSVHIRQYGQASNWFTIDRRNGRVSKTPKVLPFIVPALAHRDLAARHSSSHSCEIGKAATNQALAGGVQCRCGSLLGHGACWSSRDRRSASSSNS
jgi:hypothetical protein